VKVCFRTFDYLKARALGYAVVSVKSLGGLSGDERFQSESCADVWGDSTLYQQVLKGGNEYCWLRSTNWWHSPGRTPCRSSIERGEKQNQMLSGLNIVLLDAGCSIGGHTLDHSVASMPSLIDCSGEDALVSGYSKCFNGFSSSEVCDTKGIILKLAC
jgi:hypothetical protein